MSDRGELELANCLVAMADGMRATHPHALKPDACSCIWCPSSAVGKRECRQLPQGNSSFGYHHHQVSARAQNEAPIQRGNVASQDIYRAALPALKMRNDQAPRGRINAYPVHLDHTFVHFGPGFDTADINEHGTVLYEGACLHLIDELDARKVEVVMRHAVYHLLSPDRSRAHELVIYKLSCTPEERKEVVIIEAPNSLRSGRLQPVGLL